MKVLLTAFYGKYNASNMLVDMIDDNVDKLILTNLSSLITCFNVT